MSKVKILITGIAIGYKGVVDGKEVWKLLFPFNECHSLKFRKARGSIGAQFDFVGHLAKAKVRITVSTSLPTSSAGSDAVFDKDVLDLTNPAVFGTHTKLVKSSGWDDRGVLMTIENAIFHVNEHLMDRDKLIPHLKKKGTVAGKPTGNIAHTVFAEIDLGDKDTLTVKGEDGKSLFQSFPATDAVLWFDNDCEEKESFSNDMDMLYFLVEDADGSKKQFQVVGVSPPRGAEIESVAAFRPRSVEHIDTGLISNLAEGKPCMFVKVSDPDGLP